LGPSMSVRYDRRQTIHNKNLTYSLLFHISRSNHMNPWSYFEVMERAGRSIGNILREVLVSGWLYDLLRTGLALLFLYGGAVKLMDPRAFAKILSVYGLIPEPLLPVVAVGLPALETLAGLALLFDIRGSLAVITGLLALFTAVLGYGILQNLDVDCGCFGAEDLTRQEGLRQAFYRDVMLVGLVVPFLYLSRRVRVREVVGHRNKDGNIE
jgi:uncharacterized membrane protein YphA (DoxX/SURF4 family)